MEIECLQKKNVAMAKLREEIEKKQKSLRMECEAFEKQRARNLAHFEDYKKEETRKLQRERKLFEKHATAVRATPNRKERTEIQVLKEQLSSLQEELRKEESSWLCTYTRLLHQIGSLSQENLELKDQRLRVISLLKTSLEAESNTKYVSSVSKGDKLASPLDSRGSVAPPSCSTAAAARGSSKDSRHPDHEPKAMENSLRKPSEAGPSSSSSSQRSAKQNVSTSQPIPAHSHSCSPPRAVRPSKPTKCSEEEDAQEVIMYPDGEVEKFLASGAYIGIFPDGTRTKLSSDGATLTIAFDNGDTLDLTPDHRVIYNYADIQTTHIIYPDGVEVLHFPNNYTERHFPDGHKEVWDADETLTNVFPDGSKESVLKDGTVMHVKPVTVPSTGQAANLSANANTTASTSSQPTLAKKTVLSPETLGRSRRTNRNR
ncbi:centromere protein J-like isoform X1 [Dunckerocampus dactyliophorus]|uniref:centromere protein J-like isoform X1 n=1 Tax=Dunckerocampus dactyliophorus TaxID=161453 RepID=UPI0024058A81|nr:centromere protein J-like isoform X1 [Dunckerocampus dactyliophorus]